MTGNRWALAAAVRYRRNELGLPIDLSCVDGPSEMTVRKIEAADEGGVRPGTKRRLENALRWRAGMTDMILAGEASEDRADWVDDTTAAELSPASALGGRLRCWFCSWPAVTVGYGFAVCGGRAETPINCSERARTLAEKTIAAPRRHGHNPAGGSHSHGFVEIHDHDCALFEGACCSWR